MSIKSPFRRRKICCIVSALIGGLRKRMQCMKFAAAVAAACWCLSAPAGAPVKTLRYILPAAEASFDPALGRDLYTGHITEAIFETLYTYDYLARPVKLAPETAAALPE